MNEEEERLVAIIRSKVERDGAYATAWAVLELTKRLDAFADGLATRLINIEASLGDIAGK